MTHKTCPGCGGRIEQRFLVCRVCWSRTPHNLRATWHDARLQKTAEKRRSAKLVAARRILEYVRHNRRK